MESAPFFTPDSMVLSVWALPQPNLCILRVEKTAPLATNHAVKVEFVWTSQIVKWSGGHLEGSGRVLQKQWTCEKGLVPTQ